jgi:hypothetical protein
VLKTLARLLLERYAHRHDRYPPHPYKPWKKHKKGKRHWGWPGDHRYGAPHGYDGSYGYGAPYAPPPRPRGLKGLIVEALLRRLMRR